MDCPPSMDQYEEQLYSVFKSFDVNNEEALDESAVQGLCDALQLEERGAALVDSLFDSKSGRVTFSQFRNGLLAVLGDKQPAPSTTTDPPPLPSAASPSDEESSGREVAPRFVFGSKKYGRRSRPQQSSEPEDRVGGRAASTSRLEAEDRRARPRPRCRRSASVMDGRDDDSASPSLEHDRRIDRDEALALCRDLRMDGVDRRLIERAFDDSSVDTTVGEFFERLNSTLARTMEDVKPVEINPESDKEDDDAYFTPETIAEAWERAGIRRPRRLLAELGFANGNFRPVELESSLDEELRAIGEPPDDRAAVLVAAYTLARMRAASARRRADRIAAERDKLRVDVAEANRRAQLLAQEVDENHARIENELKTSLKRAEVRYAEEARRASIEAAAERERNNSEKVHLEMEVARRADVESHLRVEITELQRRVDELENRASTAEERLETSEHERNLLSERLREAQVREELAEHAANAADIATARLDELQSENKCLRDRIDELTSELEATTLQSRGATSDVAISPDPGGNLSVELSALLEPEKSKESGQDNIELMQNIEKSEEIDEEKKKLTELVKELETSLEAMRTEYEACEEYWSGKLAEERKTHDEEQRASDERLGELVARITEFERRLAPPSLPPIAEAAALEAQVEQLEAEYQRQQRADAARLRAAQEQLSRAHRRLAALQRRRAPAPAAACRCAALAERCRRLEAALAGGGAVAVRCARAEAAVRRLQARLVAADLLVKDLYVENSELARRRPP